MPTILLDSTVWLAAHDARDAAHDESRALVIGATMELAALDLTLYEVASVVTKKWHDPAAADRLTRLVEVAADVRLLRVGGELLRVAEELADTHGLSVYDAAYAAVSKQTGWELVSLDGDLVQPGLAVDPATVLQRASGS